MPDKFSPATRSGIMRRVKSKNARSTEWRFRALLMGSGIRGWKTCGIDLPGKPDFIFTDQKLAVFIDGCFWHGCPCKTIPQSNRQYWESKIAGNKTRDRRVSTSLRKLGWSVMRVAECKLGAHPKRVLSRLSQKIGAE